MYISSDIKDKTKKSKFLLQLTVKEKLNCKQIKLSDEPLSLDKINLVYKVIKFVSKSI